MNKFQLLLLAVLAFTFNASAAILNVNNSTPSPGEYTSLQDAIDASAPGDSIYLAATSVSYGDVTFDQELHFIGPGFVVSSGIIGNRAIVGVLNYNNDISGSSVTGIEMSRFYALVNGLTTSNVVIQRCIITDYIWFNGNTSTGWLIEGNVFTSTSFNTYPSGSNSAFTIRNNIFNGTLNSLNTASVTQNVFLGASGGTTPGVPSNVTNSNITNNIFIGRNVNSIAVSNIINGNMSFDGSNNVFPGAGVNYPNIDPEFENYTVGLFNWAHDYHLSPGSPALGVGAGGADLGIYAGDGVYRQDGEPSIPIIRSVNVPGGNVVPANSTFNINIISESHE